MPGRVTQYHKKYPYLLSIHIIEFILISITTLTFQFSSFIMYIASGIYCNGNGFGFAPTSCPGIYYTGILYVIPPLFGIWLIYKAVNNFYAVMLFITVVIVIEQVLLLKSLSDFDYWNNVIQYGQSVSSSVFGD